MTDGPNNQFKSEQAIEPDDRYLMETPNKETLEIYRGGLKVNYKDVIIKGKGKIYVRWLPLPDIWLMLQFCDDCGSVPRGKGHILVETGPNKSDNYFEINGFPEGFFERNKHLFPAKGKIRKMRHSVIDPNFIAGTVTFPSNAAVLDNSLEVSSLDIDSWLLSVPAPNGLMLADFVELSNTTSNAVSCDYIKFYITNFINYHGYYIHCNTLGEPNTYPGRMNMMNEDWTVKIDAIRIPKRHKDNSDNPIDRVKETGVFIITHTGILKRSDDSIFLLSNGINYLRAINFVTSFMRGAWCGPILSSGVKSGEIVWQDGIIGRHSAWTNKCSWMDQYDSSMENIETLFRNFMMMLQNTRKQDTIMSLVQWYVEANQNAGGTEGSIILIHSAMELLANMNGYNGPVRNILRRLIEDLRIDPCIPEKHTNLKQAYDDDIYKLKTDGKPDTWDGPTILSELRNVIVHPKGNGTGKDYRPPLHAVSKEAREEALDLGLWYLELSILKKLDYTGIYFNRINLRSEKVPWLS